jgi:uncharacterized phage infection (PIP) family protein YhgE
MEFIHDAKHINKYGVSTFAGNLKSGIRQALGIVLPPRGVSRRRIQSQSHVGDVSIQQGQHRLNKGSQQYDVRIEHEERLGETGSSRFADVQNQLTDIAHILKQLVQTNAYQSSVHQQRVPFLPMPPGLGLHSPQYSFPQQ